MAKRLDDLISLNLSQVAWPTALETEKHTALPKCKSYMAKLYILVIHSFPEEIYYTVFTSQDLIMKFFKHEENLKELYKEHSYTHHVDSTTDNSLHSLYHVSTHLSTALVFEDHIKVSVLTKFNVFLKSITFAWAYNAFVLKLPSQAK